MTTTDEQLTAYLDGQLPTDAAYETVENALAHDPATRARLDQLVWAEDRLRQALRDKYMEPVPPHLIANVWNTPLGGSSQHAQPTVNPAAQTQKPKPKPWSIAGWALAASFAILGWLRPAPEVPMSPTTAANWARQGLPVQDPMVLTTLNAVATGVVVANAHGQLVAEGTVQRANGHLCRLLAHAMPDQPAQHTWACHGGDGVWTVVATTPAAAPSATYTPAQADLPFPEPVRWLDAIQERAHLENQWR